MLCPKCAKTNLHASVISKIFPEVTPPDPLLRGTGRGGERGEGVGGKGGEGREEGMKGKEREKGGGRKKGTERRREGKGRGGAEVKMSSVQ
jgi:hypothetical protein